MKFIDRNPTVSYFCRMKVIDKTVQILNIIPIGCASALVFSAIIALTLMPGDDLPDVSLPYVDKFVHFLMFGGMSCVALFDVARYKGRFAWGEWLAAALFSVCFGIAIEIAQDLMELGRAAEFADITADALGAVLLPLPFIGVIKLVATDYTLSFNQVRNSKNIPAQIKDLYFRSFPDDERREWQSIEALINSRSRYNLTLIDSRRQCVGFISWWNLHSGVYVEHFAIDPAQRSRGLGALALEKFCLMHAEKPIVLEVELPGANDMAERRIGFYKRCGFSAHPDVEYVQPPYKPGGNAVELLLMTYGSVADVPEMAREIKKTVYGVK